ncbi:hypothetical protein ACFYUV_32050 [Nonomuraea sp. NPDC003560]|uniref:hypothetical protein n=1 Tax=Nonomuraea sp. NPDC003560 TaxID=3364341 RepID=UPI0036A471E3
MDARTRLFTAGSNSLREPAVHVAVKGFEVLEPPGADGVPLRGVPGGLHPIC